MLPQADCLKWMRNWELKSSGGLLLGQHLFGGYLDYKSKTQIEKGTCRQTLQQFE
jgi:hypothetical protein